MRRSAFPYKQTLSRMMKVALAQHVLYIYNIYIYLFIVIYIYGTPIVYMYKSMGTWLAVHNLSPIVCSVPLVTPRVDGQNQFDSPAELPDPSKSPTETGDERRHPEDNIWQQTRVEYGEVQ